jgi:hypothetical protein
LPFTLLVLITPERFLAASRVDELQRTLLKVARLLRRELEDIARLRLPDEGERRSVSSLSSSFSLLSSPSLP